MYMRQIPGVNSAIIVISFMQEQHPALRWAEHAVGLQLSKCPNSDISPCPALEEDADSWLKYAIDWPRIMDGAEHDHPETLADAVVNATAQATDTFHVA